MSLRYGVARLWADDKSSSVDDDEIERRCDELRTKLLADLEKAQRAGAVPNKKNLKMHQVHELAEVKIQESERLRKALNISKDYEEGGHWRKQEDRLKKALGRDGKDGPDHART